MTHSSSSIDFIAHEENALLDFQFAILDELEARGWTQARLAEELGVSRARISQMLSPEANPTLKLAARALAVLGLRCEYAPSHRARKAKEVGDISRFAIFEAHTWETAFAWIPRPQTAANENFAELCPQAA